MLAPEICSLPLLALLKPRLKAHQFNLRTLRSGDLWSMVCRNDATLATWTLAALIWVELGQMVGMLVVPRHPVPARVPATLPSQVRLSAGVNAGEIVSAHLFGLSVPEPVVQDPGHAPPSTADLTLAGTIATENPQRGKAIIGNPGQAKVYSVGQQVGGATLRWVYLDHVILDRNGSLETLALPRAHLAGESPAVARSAPPGSAAGSPAALPAPASQPPEGPVIDKIVDSETSNNGLGEFLGIRVLPADNRATFYESGLKEGDIVVAVNGTKLADAAHAQEMWRQVSSGSTVTVMRSGKAQEVTLNLVP